MPVRMDSVSSLCPRRTSKEHIMSYKRWRIEYALPILLDKLDSKSNGDRDEMIDMIFEWVKTDYINKVQFKELILEIV